MTGDQLPAASTSSTMRSIFIGASLCWSVSSVVVGVLMSVHALSNCSNSVALEVAGWLSGGFGGVTAVQGFLAFVKLKTSLQRYVRFGLTSAAFSRTSPKMAFAYITTSLLGFILYVSSLIEFVEASKSSISDEARSGRLGVVWFSVLGALMLSLLIGLIVVSRISPQTSRAFLQTPNS